MRLTRVDRPDIECGPKGRSSAMEMSIATGARYFLQRGPLAVQGGIQSKRLRTVPCGARWLLAERPIHPVLINPTGIDLPVTDRRRMSASEP
jgi:hypothetical protein